MLTPTHANSFLVEPVLVEEKLDGMNTCIWIEDRSPVVATRGGKETSDRSGQRGRIREWAATRADQLNEALGPGLALYGEWLLLRHSIAYAALASPLVGLDVRDRGTSRFMGPDDRDRLLDDLGIPAPPRIFSGVLGSIQAARALTKRGSSFQSPSVEGIVIRRRFGLEPRICKLVAEGFERRQQAPYGRNALATH